MYKLVIADEEGSTTVVPLLRDEITVGRKEGNAIRLTERNVSRQHAVFRKQEGSYSVQDLDSYNGVYINGKRIEHETLLKVGDQVGVGDYLLALQQAAKEATAAKAPAPRAAGAGSPPPPPGKPARLVMLSLPAPGAIFAISKGVVSFGRGEDQDAWVNHRSMSREHAEVRKLKEGYQLVDVGSSNGVRHNGEVVDQAPLTSGDVIELGKVKFRFVGEGETYVFDADRTVQMAAYELPTRSGKLPMYAALGILGVAGLASIAILSGGSDGDDMRVAQSPVETPAAAVEQAEPAPEPTAAEPAEPVADDNHDAEVTAAVAACETSLEALRAAEAVGHADRAIGLRPGFEAAMDCRGRAVALRPQEERFERGVAAYGQEDYSAARQAFDLLPGDSPYLTRPEVAAADEGYWESRLALGREALEAGRWQSAQEIAREVEAANGSGALGTQAQALARAATEGEAEATRVAAVAAAARAPSPSRPAARPERARPSRPAAMRPPPASMSRMSSEMAVAMAAAPAPSMVGGVFRAENPLQCGREPNANQCLCRFVRQGNPGAIRTAERTGSCGR